MLIPFSQLKNSIDELDTRMFMERFKNYIKNNRPIQNSYLLDPIAILQYNFLGFVELMFLSPIRLNIYAVQIESYIRELILKEDFENPKLKKILPKYHFGLCSQVKTMIQNNTLHSKYKFQTAQDSQTHIVFYEHNKPLEMQLKCQANPCSECLDLSKNRLQTLLPNKKKHIKKLFEKFNLIEYSMELNNKKFIYTFFKSSYIQYKDNTMPIELKCGFCFNLIENSSSNFSINLVEYFNLESILKIRLKCEQCEKGVLNERS